MRKLKPRLDRRITKIPVAKKFHSQLYNSVLCQANDYIATTCFMADRQGCKHTSVCGHVCDCIYIYMDYSGRLMKILGMSMLHISYMILNKLFIDIQPINPLNGNIIQSNIIDALYQKT